MEKDNLKLLESETITYLRFPLIVAVVFLHSYTSEYVMQNTEVGLNISFPIFDIIRYSISEIIARIAVPLFFFTSGFLFFYNLKEWNKKVYIDKIKKRFKSLFIPYIFWISLCLLIFFIAQNNPYTSNLFSGNNKPIIDYSITDFFSAYWSSINEGTNSPFLYPFWFIRDLMVIVLLSPIVYLIVRYLKVYGIIILFLLWFFDINTITGLSLSCSFFFTLGAYFSINKLNIIKVVRKIPFLIFLYPIIAILDLLTKDISYHFIIHNIGIVIGIFYLFHITSSAIKKNKVSISIFLSSASFFVFATHEPWLRFTRKFLYSIIQPNTEIAFILLYFVPAFLIITLSLLLFYILNKYTPKLVSFITGNR